MKRPFIVLGAVAVGLGAGTILALALTSGPKPRPVSATGTTVAQAPSPSTTTPTSSGAARATGTAPGQGPGPTVAATVPATFVPPLPTTPAGAANQQPDVVARNFLAAYLSWAGTDQPSPAVAVRARCRPWDTDVFDAELGQSSGASAFTETRIAAHEVDTVVVTSLVVEDTTPAAIGYDAVVQRTVTQDGVPATVTPVAIRVRVIRLAGVWRTNQVIAG